MLFVDLDDFKVVNDTMGHSVGDELLAAAGGRLAGLVRESDTAARLGGDEFALLIGNAADTAAVEAAAGRVVDGVRRAVHARRRRRAHRTVTVGVATTVDSADTDELLRHADLALYAAKAAGKRQWRRYQPVLSAGLIRRREIQDALEEAVSRLRVHARLPADRRPRHRGAGRVRGAGPLAAPAVGDDAARTSSSPWPRRPARSCRSAPGCWPARPPTSRVAAEPRPRPRMPPRTATTRPLAAGRPGPGCTSA